MPILCGAYTTRYVGKGLDRKEVSGHCVYDQGHDGPCLPPQLMNVDWVPVPKTEMAEAKVLAKRCAAILDVDPSDTTDPLATLTNLIEGWPDPEAVPGG